MESNFDFATGTWILVVIYFSVLIFFAVRGALKTKSISDYAIGSINFSPTFVGLSLAASMTSAATFVINPGFVANYGISGFISIAIILPIAAISSLVILSKSFRKYGKQIKALTLAQWIGERYKNKSYAYFVAVLSLLTITFVVLIVVAITKVLSKSLEANELYVLIAIIAIIFGYNMFGGANSMVYTNMIQAVIMLIVAFILISSGYQYFSDGLSSFFGKLESIDPALVSLTNPDSLLFRDLFEVIFVQIIIGIAVVVQPHIITKSLLLKKDSDVNKFLTVAGVAQGIFFLVVIAGLYARIAFPDLTLNGSPLKNDGIMSAYVVFTFAGNILSVIIGLVVVLGLLSAGMSTLEGLIQAISSTITNDIVRPVFKDFSEKKLLNMNKISIIALAIITFFVSYDQLLYPKLSVAILAQNGVYAYFSAVFIPVLFGIFLPKANYKAPLAASVTAITIHLSVYYLMPVLVEDFGFSFGYFDLYLKGSIRNPAVAASVAILSST